MTSAFHYEIKSLGETLLIKLSEADVRNMEYIIKGIAFGLWFVIFVVVIIWQCYGQNSFKKDIYKKVDTLEKGLTDLVQANVICDGAHDQLLNKMRDFHNQFEIYVERQNALQSASASTPNDTTNLLASLLSGMAH